MTDEERFARLPKWAQGRIRSLEHAVERLKADLGQRDEQLARQFPKSNVKLWNPMGLDSPDVFLPQDSHVEFELPVLDLDYTSTVTVYHEHHDGKALYISSTYGLVEIHPRASNAFELKLRR